MTCTPNYGSSCDYCSDLCQIVTLTGPYCGDGNVDPQEQCETDLDCSEGQFCDSCTCQTIPPTTGSLTICKYNDQNANGQYEELIDTPLAWGMNVTYPNQDILYTGTNGQTGCVTIEGLSFGTYSISEAAQIDWVRSYPGSNIQTADINALNLNPMVYFLNYYQEPTPTVTINAYKVVCQTEEDLPNWATTGEQAGEPLVITATTAIGYVTNSQGRCWLASGWDFQWGFNNQVSSPAGDFIGPAEGDWHNFDSSTGVLTPAEVQITDLQGTSRIWVKENLQGGYIPFSAPPTSPQNNVSAELLCHDDKLNYDNYDYIDNPQLETTYYCVGFNVSTVTAYGHHRGLQV